MAQLVWVMTMLLGIITFLCRRLRISGEVIIGEGNFIGGGAIVLQQIRIGNNVRIGAGAVLMNRPKDGNTYLGNPANNQVLTILFI